MEMVATTGFHEGKPACYVTVQNDQRITTLDGLRGLATIMVILSHYFGEVQHGIRAAMFGWMAVNMYFVLSGFLIGKLILDRQHHANFFAVFYIRRFARIIPAYLVTVILVSLLVGLLPRAWSDAGVQFPLWSYLTFTQTFFMVTSHSIGTHWLAPTWTLAVEEHFYLVIPAMIVFTPRRYLTSALLLLGIAAIALRTALYFGGGNEWVALTQLPGLADILVCGLLAAIAFRTDGIPWSRLIPVLRVTPIIALLAVISLHLISAKLSGVLTPLLIAIFCASYLLCIVLGTPEARRFKSKTLQFFGNNGYCLYLTHLPILGMMHGIILGSKPDLATPTQWIVTMAALPVCVFVGWGMTKCVEDPLTRYGRTWQWSRKLHTLRLSPAS